MLRRQLERHGKWLMVIVGFTVLALASATFILSQQRLRTPFADRYVLHAELSTSQSLTPGLGQPVNVSGVRVGDIVDVRLRDGRAVVEMSIDPDELPRVFADASVLLRPNTPLKDMQIELDPGSAQAGTLKPGATIAVARTNVPVDSDHLTAALDADTRSYFRVLVAAVERGIRGRGGDVRGVLRALGPTSAQAQRIGDLLAERRRQIRRVTHNLAVLTRAAGAKDRELAQVVSAGNRVLGAMAGEDAALRESIALLPGAVGDARRTLGHTTEFANALEPTLAALQPGASRLPSALRATTTLLDEAVPLVRQSRPFLREAQPLVRDLGAATRDLTALSPDLGRAFGVLDYAANELAYNPPGDDEGYLFWIAWAAHNLSSVVSTEDAHGAAVRGLVLTSCRSITDQPELAPLPELLSGQLPFCPPATP